MLVLKGNLDLEGQKLDKLERNFTSGGSAPLTPTPYSGDIPRLEGLVSDLSKQVNNLNSVNDAEAIKFQGLALRFKK
jgi:hypothetical protein